MEVKTLSDKAAKFLARNPTLIGTVAGDSFYEHPEHGDIVPLVVIRSNGRISYSDFYDLPSVEEWTDCD